VKAHAEGRALLATLQLWRLGQSVQPKTCLLARSGRPAEERPHSRCVESFGPWSSVSPMLAPLFYVLVCRPALCVGGAFSQAGPVSLKRSDSLRDYLCHEGGEGERKTIKNCEVSQSYVLYNICRTTTYLG
jgi:hypothetical protein